MEVQRLKTKILKIKGDWNEILNDCRLTVGKDPIIKEPSISFKKRILIAEHSPIRNMTFKWSWKGMKYWIAMHWKTHRWESKVTTQRTDRTSVDREKQTQDAPVDFIGDANIHHLIDTMRKRLCYQASNETREYAEDLKYAIHKVQPEIADVLVPNCIYRCGCPEMESCNFINGMQDVMMDINWFDIQERYDAYNKKLYQRVKRKVEEN